MIKAVKKALVCALTAALTFGTLASAAPKSPTTSVEPQKQTNVTAEKSNGITSTVDTKKDGTAKLSTVKATSKKEVTISSKVTVDGIKYAVTEIDAKAFAKCTKATKITLPSTITKINANAFTGAKKLKTIVLPITKAITVEKGAFKGLDTTKMTIKVSKKMSKKELKKFKKTLKNAGFKGKVVTE